MKKNVLNMLSSTSTTITSELTSAKDISDSISEGIKLELDSFTEKYSKSSESMLTQIKLNSQSFKGYLEKVKLTIQDTESIMEKILEGQRKVANSIKEKDSELNEHIAEAEKRQDALRKQRDLQIQKVLAEYQDKE
jgi:hypothetical protein